MICPKCKCEYREGFTYCYDCSVALVESQDAQNGKADEDNKVIIKGKQLSCLVCGGTHFTTRTSLLNSRGLTLLDLDWLNRGAINYICEDCGYIFWFAETAQNEYETSVPMADECPNCFSKIGINDIECANCGYKLKKES